MSKIETGKDIQGERTREAARDEADVVVRQRGAIVICWTMLLEPRPV